MITNKEMTHAMVQGMLVAKAPLTTLAITWTKFSAKSSELKPKSLVHWFLIQNINYSAPQKVPTLHTGFAKMNLFCLTANYNVKMLLTHWAQITTGNVFATSKIESTSQVYFLVSFDFFLQLGNAKKSKTCPRSVAKKTWRSFYHTW